MADTPFEIPQALRNITEQNIKQAHVAACEDCGHTVISYNSCGNRHCPKCQGAAARQWLAEREAELLPLPYYHVVFTLPSAIGAIAWQNKAEVYGLLFKAASETMLTIAADPRHLGARIGMTAVLHTWGSALTHHPHVHMIVPGGGLSLNGERFVPCRGRRRRFFLPVRVLSRLFRRLVLERLAAAHSQRRLILQGSLAKLAPAAAFAAALKPLRWKKWFVYIKEPFAGPKAVLAYLSRYTHRVAISNTRLIAHAPSRSVREPSDSMWKPKASLRQGAGRCVSDRASRPRCAAQFGRLRFI